ncbi:hypothetical protein [Legionella spiritensis]|uniref:Endonuclease/Exonuclease/phosphatase family protein n=1 Tax=Legionella spiritensis TaxID=452 RepID=A0A0W0Z8Q7_LEGSP|nr:hypothetical protein [Legionella spiritensis]KTD65517.1 hypothetical protein Lspi_0591 [Legionella spiritensis]SNV36089.1 Uncharacterised protein [Legionella spiritensis]
MPLTLKAITLNCGNSGPGKKASRDIIQSITDNDTDLTLLHCQETDFNKAVKQLRKSLNNDENYEITVLHQMVTHTKLSTQFHHSTGIMTIAIHKKNINIEHHDQEVRRGKSRFSSAYNKGGIFSRLTIQKRNDEKPGKTYVLDLTNAHLDAFTDATRAQDWANLHNTRANTISANSFEELCETIPDMVITGFDANTRNHLIKKDGALSSKSSWSDNPQPAMHSLLMAPMGNHRFSYDSTYKTNTPSVLRKPDKNRPSYARGGMLDLVAYNDVDWVREQLYNEVPVTEEAEIIIPPVKNGSRDHAVIGSPDIPISKYTRDFDKVRDYIACSLFQAAPRLTSYILDDDFIELDENKDYLLHIYNAYLTPDGLMQRRLQLQSDSLQWLANSEKTTDPKTHALFRRKLFPGFQPWLESTAFLSPPQSIDELKLQLSHQTNLVRLAELRNKYLQSNVFASEKAYTLIIIENAQQALITSATNESAQELVLKQTEKLLNFNQIMNTYAKHLRSAGYEGDSLMNRLLLKDKKKIIASLGNILKQKASPDKTLRALDRNLNRTKDILERHRDDDWLNRLFRALKHAILQRPVKSHGAFFVEQAESTIKINAQLSLPNKNPL